MDLWMRRLETVLRLVGPTVSEVTLLLTRTFLCSTRKAINLSFRWLERWAALSKRSPTSSSNNSNNYMDKVSSMKISRMTRMMFENNGMEGNRPNRRKV